MIVQRQDLASFVGNVGAEVLSTHFVVLLMELASRNTLEELLPKGTIVVGTAIKIRHMAAATLGAKVWAESCLKQIDGRRLLFDVSAYDEIEKLAEGENELLMVSKDGFLKKIMKKSESRSISSI